MRKSKKYLGILLICSVLMSTCLAASAAEEGYTAEYELAEECKDVRLPKNSDATGEYFRFDNQKEKWEAMAVFHSLIILR